ncbi:MAG: ornithine carbamoyltransferase [Mycoplasmataceae bacterium]|nr:ornithine carbamoyltransferase [Mycoplasmataceae bacterium]
MSFNLHGKNLMTIRDWTNEEVKHVLNLSKVLKEQRYTGQSQNLMNHKKNIAVIMQKDSTRTRSAFEVAAFDLGMNVTYIGGTGSQMGKKESIEDTAKVLSGFYDGIAFRCGAHEDVEMLGKHSMVPVWNALSDDFHPTQMFADYLTIIEEFNRTDIKFAFFGDARSNMGNSLMLMAAHMGAEFWGVAPKELWPKEKLQKEAKKIAKLTGASINFTENIEKGAKNAHVIYTDVWVSMGEPDEVWKERIKQLVPYRVTKDVMDLTHSRSIFMHCLPGFHDTNTKVGKEIHEKFGIDCMEVTDEVFRSHKSRVMVEAENRMHTIKAIMLATMGF